MPSADATPSSPVPPGGSESGALETLQSGDQSPDRSPGHLHAWQQWGPAFALCAILLLVIAAVMLDHAAPQHETLFDKRWNAPVRKFWDLAAARTAAHLLLGDLALCLAGLAVKWLAGVRKADRLGHLLLVVALLSIAGLIHYWRSVGGF